ncbi:Protein export cytoplasm protein SecA ATPase RNA helicase (TC 3.A.5.1.1) [bacterium endosymbiont of Bathymodiolus sp. 5 South]|jgi:preprotein translocase subunit SecA|nr:Protein translocase subunit SecA [uncultured Gammaproteobacteria bacterium]SHN89965.1 Protein translocase subunit SecA [bacterium endosymbiont of Bathymodiolus sp. 5 South]CAC9658717.1 Protein translocase subunit SecA [uncultured Gammaproteobacteria bacterium]SSC08011.1 Protein export cytoplasm protein SecA ATPase RNA helicase (TC 3.A.5.1.1) [bacterium endosymbiont of Bathymodiolus sp. 5 South]VVH57404.1 Protein export cytoplasm protein SecA ATPase RNA helicase (TC 3.A.5.1.1) [uncultured Gam
MSIINKVVAKIVGSHNDRLIKKLSKAAEDINALEPELQALSDEALSTKTQELKQKFENKVTLDALLPEAFAVIREVSVRILGLRHHDVQMIGGMVLHDGNIAEMGTGEGKTLVATLPAYLNALTGKGVHIVTVNDYLAARDAQWMNKIFDFLDLSVGVITSDMLPENKKVAYECDIVYATNNELGFDYLRDNMAFTTEQKVQRELNFAIIDEVDSILIDEARTPLIISGAADDYSEIYQAINHMIPNFTKQTESGEGKEVVVEEAGDYTVDEKHQQVFLTDDGHTKAENLLIEAGVLPEGVSLYDASNILLMQHINSALRAHVLFHKDDNYIVDGDEVVIVDEFTGRTMPGRRWSEGLHQAIEAKEGVSIKNENQTLASITFQNYFRLYNKLSGMTGTADTEAVEFQAIYNLETAVIPPNRPSTRNDMSDKIYLTLDEKLEAIAQDVEGCQKTGQPVLVGTSSIENSEAISALLTQKKVKHEVLNAKQHEREAQIIANAGAIGAVTIATNMAGRGTDIVLGGKLAEDATDAQQQDWQKHHDEVIKVGGLHIVGTERNESRRVDNQLRGRSGRQGDVGSTRFYLSLKDNLMRIFASEKMAVMMQRLGMEKGEAIEHKMVNRAIENAQKKVEEMNYTARKNLLEYDDVSNDQRKIIYKLRDELMDANDVQDRFIAIRQGVVSELFADYISPAQAEEDWDVEGLYNALKADYAADFPLQEWLKEGVDVDELESRISQGLGQICDYKEEIVGSEQMRGFEKAVMLQTLDHFWKEHLAAMDYLRQSVNLRGYAQKNPTQEYKRESFAMFEALLNTINVEIVKALSSVTINENTSANDVEQQNNDDILATHSNPLGENTQHEEAVVMKNTPNNSQTYQRSGEKIGRNDPCPCGSGKKYKQCHGKS